MDRRSVLKGLGTGAALSMSGCLGSIAGDAGPIKIGGFWAMSGPLAYYGRQQKRGAELMVEKLNEQGGINDRQIELINKDSTDANEAVSNVENLITNENVDVIVGTPSSTFSKAVVGKTKQHDMPYFDYAGIAGSISEPGYDNVFHGSVIADSLVPQTYNVIKDVITPALDKSMGDIKLAVLTESGEYGSQVNEVSKKVAGDRNVEIVENISYDPTASDYSSQVQRLKQAQPDIIHAAGYGGDTQLLWNTAQNLDYYCPAVIGNGTSYVAYPFLEGTNKATVKGVIGLTYPHNNTSTEWAPGAKELIQKYVEKFDEPPKNETVLLQYSGIRITAEVLKNAASFEVADVQEAALSLDKPQGFAPNGWGINFTEEYQRNERAIPGTAQWQDDNYTEDFWHPDQNDGSAEIYTVYPEEARFGFIKNPGENLPRPDYTK